MTEWTRLPDAPVGRTLGPGGPLQCTFRALRLDHPPERCAGILGHAPIMCGSMVVWDHEPAIRGHEPWPESGELIKDVGGHIWYCGRGPLSICDRCGLAYSRWDGGDCSALGPVHGPLLPTIEDYLAK